MTAKRSHYSIYAKLAALLVQANAHTATKYISPSHVVRATRIVYRGRIDKRSKAIDIRFTDGRPNYHARQFIKSCQKSGEPFPVRKIQLKFFPKQKPSS